MKARTIQTATAFLLAVSLTFGMASAAETTTSTERMYPSAEETATDPEPVQTDAKEEETEERIGRLSIEEFRLGGVSPGIREEEIRRIFGKPIYGDCETMVFSNGLVAEFDDKHPGVVEELVVAKPGTSVMTAAGITAGMEEIVIVRRYGKPDEKDEKPLYTIYTYYSVDGTLKLKFTAKDGVILKVKCETTD